MEAISSSYLPMISLKDKLQKPEKGVCGYCAINVCSKCIQGNKYCHGNDNGRSICSYHAKNNRVTDVSTDRIVISTGGLRANFQSLFAEYIEYTKSSTTLFSSFYNEFNNSAHYFEVFDRNDTEVWKSILPFTGIYIFLTPELAHAAVKLFPNLEALSELNASKYNCVLIDETKRLQFQLCYQCNSYQVRFPIHRTVSDSFAAIKHTTISRTFSPNFYSDSLCRKMNSSHDKKRKGGRKKDRGEKSSANLKSDIEMPNTPNLKFKNPPSNSDIFNLIRLDHQPSSGQKDNDTSSISSDETSKNIFMNTAPKDKGLSKNAVNYRSIILTPSGPSPLLSYWKNSLLPLANYAAPSPAFWKLKTSRQTSSPSDMTLSDNIFLSGRKNSSFTPFKRFSKNSDNENLFYHGEKSNIDSLTILSPLFTGKRKADDLEPIDLDSTKRAAFSAPIIFDENIAWSYYESRNYSEFMTYLEAHPIDKLKDSLLFYKFELIKIHISIKDGLDFEVISTIPAMPSTRNHNISPSELFNFNIPKVDATFSDTSDLIKFDFKYNSSQTQPLFSSMLPNSLKLLKPFLSKLDSSINEPLYNVLFRFDYFYHFEITKFNFTKINQNYDRFLNNYCVLILECFNLFSYLLEANCKPEILMVLKNIILTTQYYFCIITNRARLLDLRSKASLHILETRQNMIASRLASSKNKNLLDTIIEFSDFKFILESSCVSLDFKWIDCNEIFHYIMQSCLIPNETFTVNVYEPTSNCICCILGAVCTHKEPNTTKSIGNFCILHLPTYVVLEFGNNSLDEYFTKKYLSYLNKLQFNQNFPPVDIISASSNIPMPPITKETVVYFADSVNESLNVYRQHPIQSPLLEFSILLKANVDCSKLKSVSNEDTLRYRNSLPVMDVNTLIAESSYDESQSWTRLAIQLAFASRDIFGVLKSTSILVSNFLYAGNDNENGVSELEKLIYFEYGSLLALPSFRSNHFLRKYIQGQIVRDKSVLLQLKKHTLAGLKSHFFPGQIISIKINDVPQDVIYVSFDVNSKPVYITNLEHAGGDCWSVYGSDLSSIDSWHTVALDNIHIQQNAATSTLMSQRFLLHALRNGDFSFAQFRWDILARDKIVL